MRKHLSTKAVESTTLALKRINDVHCGDCLALGMFGISDRVANDVFQKDAKNGASLFIDKTRNTLNTTTACKTTNGGLGDSLNVVTKNLSMTLGSSLSKTFSCFSSSRHQCVLGLSC